MCFERYYVALQNAQNDTSGFTSGSSKQKIYNLISTQNIISCTHVGEIKKEEKVIRPVWDNGILTYQFLQQNKKNERKIVTLCGSTRYYWVFAQFNLILTCAGFIVLSIGCDTHSDDQLVYMQKLHATKEELDQLHFEKIEMSNIVLILNSEDYVGKSTGREIAYARSLGKELWWLREHMCHEECHCRVQIS